MPNAFERTILCPEIAMRGAGSLPGTSHVQALRPCSLVRLLASIRGSCGGSYGHGMGPKTGGIRLGRWAYPAGCADTRAAERG